MPFPQNEWPGIYLWLAPLQFLPPRIQMVSSADVISAIVTTAPIPYYSIPYRSHCYHPQERFHEEAGLACGLGRCALSGARQTRLRCRNK